MTADDDQLTAIAEHVPDCVVAAWVDARTGEMLHHHARSDESAAAVIDPVIEILRSPERPRSLVLLAARRVYIAHKVRRLAHRVLVVVCERSANLGVAVALVRAHADSGGDA